MVRQHPQTLWRTGDFCRLSFSRAVYRVDGVAAGGNVTIVPCSDAGKPQAMHPTALHWPDTEDVPEDPRELAILWLLLPEMEIGVDSLVLASSARRAVFAMRHNIKLDRDIDDAGEDRLDIEAAALLRDGWNPGDPVEVLP